MFNIKKSIDKSTFYLKYFPFFYLFFLQSILAISLLEIFRQQLPEIKLIQLIPGSYFFFLFFFIAVSFLLICGFIFFPSIFDGQKNLGTKNIIKNKYSIYNKFLYFFSFLTLIIGINFILPGQFDNFYSYTEKNFENIWSFEELINLEGILLFILVIISQFPLGIISIFDNEIKIFKLPEFFKIFLFFIFFLSGLLTPTVDATSQIIFSFFTIFFYLISIHFLIKRIQIKYLDLSNLD